MGERISQAEAARRAGVSAMTMSRAKKSGRIVVGKDGLLDADQLVAFQENASRPPNSGLAGRGYESPKGGTVVSLLQVQTAKMAAEAQLKKLQLDQKRGELVNRNVARGVAFGYARRLRDAWLSWPAREVGSIVGDLAALGVEVDQRRLLIVLEKYVRQHLTDLADAAVPDFGGDEQRRSG